MNGTMQKVQNLSQPYMIGTCAFSFGSRSVLRSGTSATIAPLRGGSSSAVSALRIAHSRTQHSERNQIRPRCDTVRCYFVRSHFA